MLWSSRGLGQPLEVPRVEGSALSLDPVGRRLRVAAQLEDVLADQAQDEPERYDDEDEDGREHDRRRHPAEHVPERGPRFGERTNQGGTDEGQQGEERTAGAWTEREGHGHAAA